MYIAPNSELYILHGCPLDSTYDHTIYFNNGEEQFNYFRTLQRFHLTEQSYQRYADGQLRVQLTADDLYDCNYIMFRNTSFGNKWFYAFVTNVEYVSNYVSTLHYDLDIMQTWFFDYELQECFVEREHSATDVIGENTVPENLQIGEYQINGTIRVAPIALQVWLYATEPLPEDVYPAPLPPQYLGGQALPCYAYSLGNYDAPETYEKLKILVDAYTAEQKIGGTSTIVSVYVQPYWGSPYGERFSQSFPTRQLPIAVKNNKLYTYPYCMCSMQCDGTSATLHYELFENPTAPAVTLFSTFGPNAQLTVAPANYAGRTYAIQYQLQIGDWPTLPYTVDSWQQWLALNKAHLISGAVGGVVDLATGFMGANISNTMLLAKTRHSRRDSRLMQRAVEETAAFNKVEVAASAIKDVANCVANVYNAYNLPDQMIGTAASADPNTYDGRKGVYLYAQSIRPEYIRIADDFFTMFGYATNRLKVPNRNVRPHWTYTKTAYCMLTGSLPEEVANSIKGIYNNGITFWRNPSEIGNYGLDNSV